MVLPHLLEDRNYHIFRGDGLPHNKLAAQIVTQAKISEENADNFVVVLQQWA